MSIECTFDPDRLCSQWTCIFLMYIQSEWLQFVLIKFTSTGLDAHSNRIVLLMILTRLYAYHEIIGLWHMLYHSFMKVAHYSGKFYRRQSKNQQWLKSFCTAIAINPQHESNIHLLHQSTHTSTNYDNHQTWPWYNFATGGCDITCTDCIYMYSIVHITQFLRNSPANDEGTLTIEVGVVCDSKGKKTMNKIFSVWIHG